MDDITPDFLAELERKFLGVDVQAIANSINLDRAHNPRGLLTALCKTAQKDASKRKNPPPPPDPIHWSPTEGRILQGPAPYEPPCAPSRAIWYTSLMEMLWALPEVPTAPDMADLIEKLPGNAPPDLPVLMDRLRHWPPNTPYVPLADDDPLTTRSLRPDYFNASAWTPGSKLGTVIKTTRSKEPVTDPANETYFKKILGNPGEPPELRIDPDA